MINTQEFFQDLVKSNGGFFVGVLDSLMQKNCLYIMDNIKSKNYNITANQGNVSALGIGCHLSIGKLPFMYMQKPNKKVSCADGDGSTLMLSGSR